MTLKQFDTTTHLLLLLEMYNATLSGAIDFDTTTITVQASSGTANNNL